MDDFSKAIGVAIGTAVAFFFILLFVPLVYAAAGYFTGWVLASVFKFAGVWVAGGATAMGLEITAQQLPAVGAFLGFAGSFFKSSLTNKKE